MLWAADCATPLSPPCVVCFCVCAGLRTFSSPGFFLSCPHGSLAVTACCFGARAHRRKTQHQATAGNAWRNAGIRKKKHPALYGVLPSTCSGLKARFVRAMPRCAGHTPLDFLQSRPAASPGSEPGHFQDLLTSGRASRRLSDDSDRRPCADAPRPA